MEINLGTILATIINFLILYFFLKHFFFEKVRKILNDRESYINGMVLETEKEREESLTVLIQNKEILDNAQEKGRLIIEEEKLKAVDVYNEIVKEAKNEAALILDRAKHEINQEKVKVRHELRKEAVEMAIDLSKKIIVENVGKETNKKMISEFLSKIG